MNILTDEYISTRTHMANMYKREIKKLADDLTKDPDREIRLRLFECCQHFYGSRIAGQAFTAYNCQNCGKEDRHPNTGVPRFCVECAQKYDVCRHCGAEL